MKKISNICLVTLIALILPAFPAVAQDLPSAKQVLSNYMKAVGGEEAYTGTKSVVVQGQISIKEQGIEGEFDVTQKAPNRMIMEMNIAGIGQQRQGFDGETAWQISEVTGPEIFEDEQATQFALQADIAPFANAGKKFESIECTAKEKFDDQECYVLTAKAKGLDDPIYFYFSADSGLQVGMKMNQASAMGKLEVVSKIRDYRDVDGLKMSFETEAVLPVFSLVTKIKSAKRNVDVADSKFELPEEIKEIKN